MQHFQSEINYSRKEKVIRFFFPFFPLKILKIPYFICLIASLLALRVILQFISVPVPQFNMTFSLSHTPIIVAGWLFGPVFGLVFGMLTDSIMFLINPPLAWFWLYAIQEALLCMISGLMGSIFILRLNAKNNWIDLIVLKIIAVAFFVATYVLVIFYVSEDTNMQGSSGFSELFFTNYKWIALAFLLLFFLVFEIFFWHLKKKKKTATNMVIYISTLGFLNAFIFSFLLGTISSIEFFKFLNNGDEPPSLIKYGSMFYLLPRIIKESIKTPLQIIALIGIIYAVNPMLKNFMNNIQSVYEYSHFFKKNVLHDKQNKLES